MSKAEVGDDVYGEDPTVNRLEEHVAELLGKEAALFVPSGVMANQIGILLHTQPGDEVIIDRQSHIFNYESGAPGVLAGVQLHVVDGPDGRPTPEQVESAIRPGHYWEARSQLLCLENTINKAGGVIFPLEEIEALAELARARALSLHLDGARLWNASAASGVSERDFAAPFDTVMVALSKGLGAPVGSVIAGSSEAMTAARRYRKQLGGGMRQAGILAAAGLYAIEHHRPLLARDHAHARKLADGLAALESVSIDPETVQTNIVMFEVNDGEALPVVEALQEKGVLLSPFGPTTIRATTHRDVSSEDIDAALATFQQLYG